MTTKPLPKAKIAEDMGAMAGLRHAEVMNAKIVAGASILYDPWQDALLYGRSADRHDVESTITQTKVY